MQSPKPTTNDLAALMIVSCGLAACSGSAEAGSPPSLAPPPGHVLFLTARAVGTQDYICLPTTTDPHMTPWKFERPQAVLSVPETPASSREVAEHLLSAVPAQAAAPSLACTEAADGQHQYCPTWRSPRDGSAVWAEKLASVKAGTDPHCPNPGAIACLLLKSVATSEGRFSGTTYVQRIHTVGGAPPTTACTAGQIEQVPYTADYLFFR